MELGPSKLIYGEKGTGKSSFESVPNTNEYLFVGGELDSQKLEVELINNKPPIDLESSQGAYKRVVLNFNGDCTLIYAHSDLFAIEAINMLIQEYAREF
jgi:hypothetical protein